MIPATTAWLAASDAPARQPRYVLQLSGTLVSSSSAAKSPQNVVTIQSAFAWMPGSGTTATVTLSLPNPVAAGHGIVVVVLAQTFPSSSANNPVVSDSQGNAYARVAPELGNQYSNAWLYVAETSLASTLAVTVSLNAAMTIETGAVYVAECSDTFAATPVADAQNTNFNPTGTLTAALTLSASGFAVQATQAVGPAPVSVTPTTAGFALHQSGVLANGQYAFAVSDGSWNAGSQTAAASFAEGGVSLNSNAHLGVWVLTAIPPPPNPMLTLTSFLASVPGLGRQPKSGPSIVQKAQGYTGAGPTTITVAFTSPVTLGNMLVAFAYVNESDAPNSTISDTLGNTWTSARVEGSTPKLWDSAAAIWYSTSAGGGADSVTVSSSATNLLLLQIYEVTGTNGTLRTSGHASTSSSTPGVSTAAAPGLGVPALAGDYAMSFLWTLGGYPFTAGSGYTLQQQQVQPTYNFTTATEDGIVAAAGDVTAGFGITGTASVPWGEYLLVFGPAPPPPPTGSAPPLPYLIVPSGQGQSITETEGHSSIASLDITCIDPGAEVRQYASVLANIGEGAQFFMGYPGLDFSDYTLLHTTQISEINSTSDGLMGFSLQDPNRSLTSLIWQYGGPYQLWEPNTTYAAGAQVIDLNGNLQQAVFGGVSNPLEPKWSNSAGQFTMEGAIVNLWQTNIHYLAGAQIRDPGGHVQTAGGGVSGKDEPNWSPVLGGTARDGVSGSHWHWTNSGTELTWYCLGQLPPPRQCFSTNTGYVASSNPRWVQGNPIDIIMVCYQNELGMGQANQDDPTTWTLYDPISGTGLINPNPEYDVALLLQWKATMFSGDHLEFKFTSAQTAKNWVEDQIFKSLGIYSFVRPDGMMTFKSMKSPAATTNAVHLDQRHIIGIPAISRWPIINYTTARFDSQDRNIAKSQSASQSYASEFTFIDQASADQIKQYQQQQIECNGLRLAWGGYLRAWLVSQRIFARHAWLTPIYEVTAHLTEMLFELADLALLSHPLVPNLLDPQGRRGLDMILCEVVDRQPNYAAGTIAYKLADCRFMNLTTPYQIAPALAGIPPWASASPTQRATYFFISPSGLELGGGSLGPSFPSAVTQVTRENDWVNLTHVEATDSTYCTCTLYGSSSSVNKSSLLQVTGFGFSVPSGAIVTGVQVFMIRQQTAGTSAVYDDTATLLGAGAAGDRSNPRAWSASDSLSYGSSNDLWGATLTPAIVNSSTFGFEFGCECTLLPGTGADIGIDSITMKVSYTLGGQGGPGFPGSVAQVHRENDWSSLSNIQATDSAYATCVLYGTDATVNKSSLIQATNFGFAIPAGAVLNGIVVVIARQQTGGTSAVYDDTVTLLGVGGSSDRSRRVAWTSSETAQYGSTLDLWDAEVTPALLNSSAFGVQYGVACTLAPGTGADIGIDSITVTVFYTGLSGAPAAVYSTIF